MGCLPPGQPRSTCQLRLGVRLAERLQLPDELFPELRAALPRPPCRPFQDLGSFARQHYHASGVMCCLQLTEYSVFILQPLSRGLEHPLYQALGHVEVPSSRLSFAAGCSPDPHHFREHRLAMAHN
jgi:hypothetical protein